jgi:hypothetical protein
MARSVRWPLVIRPALILADLDVHLGLVMVDPDQPG